MTQDETNVLVLFILLGIIWTVVRNAIDQISSKSDGINRPLASLATQNQTLAETSSGLNSAGGIEEISTDALGDLELIGRIDPTFDAHQFLNSGCLVYEAIVRAFAYGDRELLRDLASEAVYNVFEEIIQAREQRGEHVEITIIRIEQAKIVSASLFNRQAQITFLFTAQLVTATRTESGTVVDGDPKKIMDVRDFWTFASDLTSKSPAWKLIATDAE